MRPIISLLVVFWWLAASSDLVEAQVPPPVINSKKPAELRTARQAILTRERSQLQALADRLKAEGNTVEAEQAGPDPADAPAADGSSRFILLPEVVAAKPKTAPTERETIQLETAKALFDLATKAASPPESYAFADDCLRNVLARNPDHAEARRLLGFVSYRGGWATPYAVEMLRLKKVADPTYGWVLADWVPHLQRGELPARGTPTRWVSTAEADAARRDWATRWEITTEHFRISTNVPLNEAISFGRKLEDLHQIFFAMIADVIGTERLPLAQRFKKPDLKPAMSNKPPFQVDFFATRDEYAQYTAPFQGDAGQKNLGIYLPKKDAPKGSKLGMVSYFFNDVNGQLDVASTLYHEASHQLLFETAGPDDYVKNIGNFWVFEGLGTYFETLQHEPDGNLRIGGLVGPRIAQARDRVLVKKQFVPLDQLVGYTKSEFWAETGVGNVYTNYAEAMALAVFLMQAGNERYREPFLDYVQDAYKGRFRGASGQPLHERLGVSYRDLDREFLEYLGRGMKP